MRADENQHTKLLYTVDAYLGKYFKNYIAQYKILPYNTRHDLYSLKHVRTCTSISDKMIFKECLHTLLSYQSIHGPFFYEHITILKVWNWYCTVSYIHMGT